MKTISKKNFTLIEIMMGVTIVALLIAILGACVSGCQISDGQRKGTITKLSERGLIWKTWEGELVMGGLIRGSEGTSQANVWEFSIWTTNRNRESIIKELQTAIENDLPVCITYHQSLIVWPWNASTNYDVLKVQVIEGAGK